MKQINELTDNEAKEILKFVYPKAEHNHFIKISFEAERDKGGNVILSISGFRPIVGIQYHNGQDTCILYFDDSKVVLWLYKNGYDITKLLEVNSYFTEMEHDFRNFAFAIEWMAKGEEGFREGHEHKWTLDYVKRKCKELVEKYYYKDYDS